MRIVGGEFKSRKLVAPRGMVTRPTTDRTRESLFNILSNLIEFADLRVLDLFAGSGALGLEAISRGAGFSLFVEQAAQARATVQSNIEQLGLQGKSKLIRRDATKLGTIGTMYPFDLVFADPPYCKGLGEKAFAGLIHGNWLRSGALCVLEENASCFPEEVNQFELLDHRQFGDTVIGILKYHSR